LGPTLLRRVASTTKKVPKRQAGNFREKKRRESKNHQKNEEARRWQLGKERPEQVKKGGGRNLAEKKTRKMFSTGIA